MSGGEDFEGMYKGWQKVILNLKYKLWFASQFQLAGRCAGRADQQIGGLAATVAAVGLALEDVDPVLHNRNGR